MLTKSKRKDSFKYLYHNLELLEILPLKQDAVSYYNIDRAIFEMYVLFSCSSITVKRGLTWTTVCIVALD